MDMLNDFSTLTFPSSEPYGAASESSLEMDGRMELPPLLGMEIDDFPAPAVGSSMTNSLPSREIAHLPTPQSPGDLASYVANSSASPVPLQGASPMRRPAFETVTHQMVTPDSSPLVNRWTLPDNSGTPTRRLSPRSLVPNKSPASPTPLGPALSHTPPPIAANPLSSPFSPYAIPQSLATAGSDSPMRSPATIEPAPSPSSSAIVVNAGGELERIRAARVAKQQETEARRPDYLQRASFGAAAGRNAGIAESPVKGRRIELFGFTETSEESFEERLMAGGYVGYGSTRGATEPPTTPIKSFNELLQQSTPATTNKSQAEDIADVDELALDDNQRRKRKRVQAFKSERAKSKAILYPVDLDDQGRVLIDLHVPKEEPKEQPETPKRKGGRRRKPRPKGARAPPGAAPNGEPGLHWPDEQFPWSVRTDERKEIERMEEAERLKLVAHYLDSDASGSEDEDEDPIVPLPLSVLDLNFRPFPPPPPGRGLGKSIPQPEAARRSVFVPSDSADARAALLCQRRVRELLSARRIEEMAVCICGEGDNGQEQVQCDDCSRWYHLHCLNIGSIDELGPEEDDWFCYACVDDGRGRAPPGLREEPTFVRDDLIASTLRHMRDPLFYDADSYPGSPTPSTSHPPATPMAHRDLPTRANSLVAEPRTPTPAHASARVRVYETPNMSADGIELFDPSSTPSRGIRQKEGSGNWDRARYGGPFIPYVGTAPPANHGAFSTPGARGGLATPVARGGSMSLPRFGHFSGQYVPASAGFDDTPVDRSLPRLPARTMRAVAESPLTGRESRTLAIGADGSPSLRAV